MFRYPLVILLVGVVTIVMMASLYISGSPLKARAEKFDLERINHLQQISYAIDSYWADQHKVPTRLEDLFPQTDRFFTPSLHDPRTNNLYEYHAKNGEGTYELCAIFETKNHPSPYNQVQGMNTVFWQHDIGRTCFSFQVRTLRSTP